MSHEMCHLACWIISNAPDEQHGSIFKGWYAVTQFYHLQKLMRPLIL